MLENTRKALKSLFTENAFKKRQLKNTKPKEHLGQTIYDYDPQDSTAAHIKTFSFIHYIFKYRFWVPLLYLARGILGKHHKKHPKRTWYNKNMVIFDEAFDESVREFWEVYITNLGRGHKEWEDPKHQAQFKPSKWKKNQSTEIMMTMKELLLTMCIHDTAYREFLNILMFNITIRMNQSHKEKTQHLFYNSNRIDDVRYFLLGPMIDGSQMNLYDLGGKDHHTRRQTK